MNTTQFAKQNNIFSIIFATLLFLAIPLWSAKFWRSVNSWIWPVLGTLAVIGCLFFSVLAAFPDITIKKLEVERYDAKSDSFDWYLCEVEYINHWYNQDITGGELKDTHEKKTIVVKYDKETECFYFFWEDTRKAIPYDKLHEIKDAIITECKYLEDKEHTIRYVPKQN